jgi:AcrR family transcriptional regulator
MKRVDRRVTRTRNALRQALISLLRRKNYDQITVQDILDEADVGRSTFYTYCTGKEDLLRRGLRLLRTELSEAPERVGAKSDGMKFSRKVLEHVAAHRTAYPALGRNRGRAVMLDEMRLVVLDLLRDELDATSGAQSVPRELIEQFVVGAFMSLLVFWLEHRTKYSPAQIDAIFQQLTLRGLESPRT